MCCGGTLQTMRSSAVMPPSTSLSSRFAEDLCARGQDAEASSVAAAARRCCPRCRAARRRRPRPAARRASDCADVGRLPFGTTAQVRARTGALVAPRLRPGLGVADDDRPRPARLEHGGEIGAAARGRQDQQAADAQRRQAGDQKAEARRCTGCTRPTRLRDGAPARSRPRGPGARSMFARPRRRPAGPDGLARPPGACRGAATSMTDRTTRSGAGARR